MDARLKTFHKILTGLGIREVPLTDELGRSFPFLLKKKQNVCLNVAA